MAFSLAYYRAMLGNLQAANWALKTVAKALELTPHHAVGTCVLRHDVDRLPSRAVAMATLENKVGIRATYYFRCRKSGRFPVAEIKAIAALNHEVGYHYETLTQHSGDMIAASDAFQRNLSYFREIAPCHTVSMHGAPLSRYDNQTLIEQMDLSALGLRGDAVRDMARLQPIYVTDTGGSWNSGGHRNRRDMAGELIRNPPDFLDRRAMVEFSVELRRPLYINSHPERWPASAIGRFQTSATDALANVAKRLARAVA